MVDLQSNERIILTEAKQPYFLERGRINLFAIAKAGAGRLTLLAPLEAPCLLIPLPPSDSYHFYGIAEAPSQLHPRPLDALCKEEVPLLEKWISTLSTIFQNTFAPEISTYLAAGQSYTLAAEGVIAPKKEGKQLLWMAIEEGELALVGDLLFSKGSLPLTPDLWLQSKGSSRIHTYTTQEAWDRGLWRSGLETFHHFLIDYFLKAQSSAEIEEGRRYRGKQQRSQEDLHEALEQLAQLLHPERPTMVLEADPLLRSLQALEPFLDVHFTLPDDFSLATDISMQIASLCQAAQVRQRQVRLRGSWWRRSCGPLLAFEGVQLSPVALLPCKGGYEKIDPATGKKRLLDRKAAAELAPLAYTFYRPIPLQAKRGRDLISFYLRGHAKSFLSLLIYGTLGALLSLFVPLATALLFNVIIPDADYSMLAEMTLGLSLAAISTAVFFFFRSLILVRIAGEADYEIQTGLWDRLLKLPVSFFRRFSAGNLLLRVTTTEQIRSLLSDNAVRIALGAIFSLFYLIAMAFYSWQLTLLALLILSLGLAVTAICAYFLARLETEILDLQGEINTTLVQLIGGVGKLRIAGAEEQAFAHWAKLFAKKKQLEMRSQMLQNSVTTLNTALPFLALMAIFAATLSLEKMGAISLGAFLAFNAAYTTLASALFNLAGAMSLLVPILPLWKRSQPILLEQPEVTTHLLQAGRLRGQIDIDNLSFSYDAKSPPVLSNITLSIAPKECIAFVGPSGSGKSTLVRLLLSFESPSQGAIYFDGQDLSHLNIYAVRKQIGAVLQGGSISGGSLRDNITCGGSYTQEQIDRALALAGFSEELAKFPMGLHTFVSTGGETLSGGQRQRLLIARALLPNPRLLILDEATSALDNKTQGEITQNLATLDVTKIFFAHRLSTIRAADRIYVLDQGKIVETGTFENLSKGAGLFADMLKRQRL